MIRWPLFFAVQILQMIAGAVNNSTHRQHPPHERSTAIYAAVLGGNGKIADGWPRIDQWADSLETMFENNKGTISVSCAEWGLPNNSEDEIQFIKDAIFQAEKSSGVDARFILSIVMQESKGCVRVQTTNNGVANPGLMQSHDGPGSCNKNGAIQNPCPRSEILQMILDGVEGTPAGPGLMALIAQEGGAADVTSYYKAARAYNSGAVASNGNLGQGGATHCYVSDVANRLMGWTDGPSLCAPDAIGQISAAFWDGDSSAGRTDRNETSNTTTARIFAHTHGSSSSSLSAPSIPTMQSSVTWTSARVSRSSTSLACRREGN
ncbi:hypothetical protein N7478_010098 [Penicillium angulare]|uniref:uncharacterized protein n=1 Tax=Penicillium angulare TaxID=116970 RepID=UPI0025401689|nr:uncharacterized protein N7478_010098 [Penicillium angulare]KAJ5267290.1 hypothetical protein N7478_010098 [Penicillium angulare]